MEINSTQIHIRHHGGMKQRLRESHRFHLVHEDGAPSRPTSVDSSYAMKYAPSVDSSYAMTYISGDRDIFSEADNASDLYANASTGDADYANATASSNSTGGSLEECDFACVLNRLCVPPMLFFCLVTMVVNVVVVCSVVWIRRPLSPTLRFSVSLAGADAYASLVLGIGLLVNSYLPSYGFRAPACLALSLEALRLGGVVVTVLHLLALAINHYIGIVRPLHYTYTITPRATNGCILVLWLSPIIFFFIYFSSIEGQGFQSAGCSNCVFLIFRKFRSLICSFFFTPMIAMFLIYAHIFFIIRRHQANRQRYQGGQDSSRNVKAIITTLLILGTCLVGWMPAVLMFRLFCEDCIYPFPPRGDVVMSYAYITSNILIIMKSMVDPIIYAARMKDIKTALRRMGATCCGACVSPLESQFGTSSEYSQHRFSLHHTRINRGTILYRVRSFQSTPDGSLRRNGTNGHLPVKNQMLYRHNTMVANKTRTDTFM